MHTTGTYPYPTFHAFSSKVVLCLLQYYGTFSNFLKWNRNTGIWIHFTSNTLALLTAVSTDISQYRLRLGFPLLYETVFHLNSLTAQLSYEGRAAVEGDK
jgi:hypothetical protein